MRTPIHSHLLSRLILFSIPSHFAFFYFHPAHPTSPDSPQTNSHNAPQSHQTITHQTSHTHSPPIITNQPLTLKERVKQEERRRERQQ